MVQAAVFNLTCWYIYEKSAFDNRYHFTVLWRDLLCTKLAVLLGIDLIFGRNGRTVRKTVCPQPHLSVSGDRLVLIRNRNADDSPFYWMVISSSGSPDYANCKSVMINLSFWTNLRV